jgi:hypothetical protein
MPARQIDHQLNMKAYIHFADNPGLHKAARPYICDTLSGSGIQSICGWSDHVPPCTPKNTKYLILRNV